MTEGDSSTLTAIDTAYGTLGGLISWENYMPLARMAVYSKGIDIYLAPTADARDSRQAILRHIACEGRCFVLGCNQFVTKSMYPSDLDVPVQMRHWADSGLIELRFPAAEDTQQLAAVLKAFRSWAALQSGGPGFDLNLLKAYHSQRPFLDAPFASQIRSELAGPMPGSSCSTRNAAMRLRGLSAQRSTASRSFTCAASRNLSPPYFT